MSARPIPQHNQTAAWRSFWSQRSAQERKLISAAAVVIVLALTYSILIEPAMNGRARLEKSLPALRLQAADMQAMVREAASLNGKTAAPPASMSKKNIEAVLAQNGIQGGTVAMVGDFAKMQLNAVPFSALMNSLSDLQKNARISVTDANVEAQTAAGMVNASLTLRQLKSE